VNVGRTIRRALQTGVAVVGALLYVWYAAVRLTPGVKRRKAERRRAR